MEQENKLLAALLAVQGEIQSLTKDRSNPFANSDYATLDHILDHLLPILTEHKLVLKQYPVSKKVDENTWIGVTTSIRHIDGEMYDFGEFLMPFEKGSKMNLSQSAGSIVTYAQRYTLKAIFSIRTNDDTDGVTEGAPRADNYQQHTPTQYQQPNNNQQWGKQKTDPLEGKRRYLNDTFNEFFKNYMTSQIYASNLSQMIGVDDILQADLSALIGSSKQLRKQIQEQENKKQQAQQAPQNNFKWGQQ